MDPSLSLPKIAIVGRPNVGKSALFNRILGKRVAIVDSTCGVTRDRKECEFELFSRKLLLIDTGGVDLQSSDRFAAHIETQAMHAARQAEVLIFVVDATVGVSDLDERFAKQILKEVGKDPDQKVLLAVNKVDPRRRDLELWPFEKLGMGEPFPLSALHGQGVMELLEKALLHLEEIGRFDQKTALVEENRSKRLAIVGRPNVGKSTFVNSVLKEPRCIVSEEAGTTRDAIDCDLQIEDESFTLIDTAGIRRIPKQKDVVEKFAYLRTLQALERCDVAILLLDALEGMTTQEKRIARAIDRMGRGCILFLNKWDLAHGMRMEHAQKALMQELPFLRHCPLVIGSALKGRKLAEVFSLASAIVKARDTKIPTGKLNQMVEKAIQKNHPPMIRGKRLRIYYLTQVAHNPPTFKLFINHSDLMHTAWKRYLIAQMRATFDLQGLPVRLLIEDKAASKAKEAEEKERS